MNTSPKADPVSKSRKTNGIEKILSTQNKMKLATRGPATTSEGQPKLANFIYTARVYGMLLHHLKVQLIGAQLRDLSFRFKVIAEILISHDTSFSSLRHLIYSIEKSNCDVDIAVLSKLRRPKYLAQYRKVEDLL